MAKQLEEKGTKQPDLLVLSYTPYAACVVRLLLQVAQVEDHRPEIRCRGPEARGSEVARREGHEAP